VSKFAAHDKGAIYGIGDTPRAAGRAAQREVKDRSAKFTTAFVSDELMNSRRRSRRTAGTELPVAPSLSYRLATRPPGSRLPRKRAGAERLRALDHFRRKARPT
jgi:hypothetical protein